MKRNTLRTWTLLGLFAILAGAGCSHEVSHTESNKANWLDDGRTRTETTVTQNPDGSINTEHSTQTTH